MEQVTLCLVGILVLAGLVQANTGYGNSGYGTSAGASNSSMGGGMGGGMAAPAMGGSNSSMGGMNMNFNLSTPQGIMGFLNMEGINPSQLVTTNCVANGMSCSSSGQSCCLSPVFSCQGSPGTCRVVAQHTNHIPQIKQIVQTAGVTTQNPIQ